MTVKIDLSGTCKVGHTKPRTDLKTRSCPMPVIHQWINTSKHMPVPCNFRDTTVSVIVLADRADLAAVGCLLLLLAA